MLKYRMLTAFLMGPIILWGVYSLPEVWFSFSAIVLFAIGAWEWSAFVGLTKSLQRNLFVVFNIVLFVVTLYFKSSLVNYLIIFSSVAWWFVSIPLLLLFPFNDKNILHSNFIKAFVGVLLLLATLVSMVLIRNDANYGPEFVIYIILMIWFVDSGAYFAGRTLGKNKLLPKVSPGKTWEGVIGALVVALVFSIVSINALNISADESMFFVLVSFITVVYSIVGDLSESMFKRMSDIKDSGHIIPGHGGILDRIDSLMSALPIFFVGLLLMESLR